MRGDPLPEARPAEPEDCVPGRRGLPPGASRGVGERLLARHEPPSDPNLNTPLSGDPAATSEDGARLRAVFDALDGDGDGFVRIEDFVQFATVYGAEQVTGRQGSAGSGHVCGKRVCLEKPSRPPPALQLLPLLEREIKWRTSEARLVDDCFGHGHFTVHPCCIRFF